MQERMRIMSKITDFYTLAMKKEETRKALEGILNGKLLKDADDGQLSQVGVLAAELGYDITLEEAKEYLNSEETELNEEDLDAVAGGKGVYMRVTDMEHGTDTGDIRVGTYI